MTFNQLFTNQRLPILFANSRARADMVGLQEFSEPDAEALKTELISEYPYQLLEPGNHPDLV